MRGSSYNQDVQDHEDLMFEWERNDPEVRALQRAYWVLQQKKRARAAIVALVVVAVSAFIVFPLIMYGFSV